MHCRIADIRGKEVIDVCSGNRLGYPSDVEIDAETGQLVALVVPGACKYLGMFGREEDIVIPWHSISRIGEDLILVER
ncbi:MAG: YlmC/YmxH family sporulation protein [Oscillospiraceae bacterium]|jgi:YlmC/YmxH family sporulation protein|nr:YlmC/YmxH family sporulation protein [Oscillospiraceae bacterium]